MLITDEYREMQRKLHENPNYGVASIHYAPLVIKAGVGYTLSSSFPCATNLKEGSMWRILLTALLLAGCAQLPPSPQDIQAKRFEPLPDKVAIYVVRTPMDSREASGLILDDSAQITTHPRTYYRWEVTPGLHRVAGFASAHESVTLTTAAGKIYFLEHTVIGTRRSGPQYTSLRQIDERDGRALVMQAQLL